MGLQKPLSTLLVLLYAPAPFLGAAVKSYDKISNHRYSGGFAFTLSYRNLDLLKRKKRVSLLMDHY